MKKSLIYIIAGIIIFIVAMLLLGCTSQSAEEITLVKSGNSLVIGKFSIDYSGQNITQEVIEKEKGKLMFSDGSTLLYDVYTYSLTDANLETYVTGLVKASKEQNIGKDVGGAVITDIGDASEMTYLGHPVFVSDLTVQLQDGTSITIQTIYLKCDRIIVTMSELSDLYSNLVCSE